MGKYDSSKYRVVPLVDVIKSNEEYFKIFIQMVGLPPLSYPSDSNAFWCGDREKQLKPPKQHLAALIDYLAVKEHKKIANYGTKRNALFGIESSADREKARIEARRLLDETYENEPLPKAWYIFEGCTNPDIYIEGDDYIIICEGKWTESHITTKTTHLHDDNEFRNQMIRHIQGTLNFSNKKVYAFYIVDADCGYSSDLTLDALKKQLELETIKPTNKEQILEAFYGYTTWQNLQRVIPTLCFYSKAEIEAMNEEIV